MTDTGTKKRRAALVEAMQSIPDCRLSLPDLEQIALDTDLVAGFARINDLPRAQLSGQRAAQAELERLRDLAVQLTSHIWGMHAIALGAFEAVDKEGTCHPLLLTHDLAKMGIFANRAIKIVPEAQSPLGRTKKRQAGTVTKMCAKEYERISGRRPTIVVKDNIATGPFLIFLTAVFNALNVDASPEAAARAYMEKRRVKAGL